MKTIVLFRRFLPVVLSFVFASGLHAESLQALLGRCAPGARVTLKERVVVEGIVVSDWRNPNMETNPNLSSSRVDLDANRRTAYVQTPSGDRGIRLVFADAAYNDLERFDHVRLDLDGATLVRAADTDALSVEGLMPENVLSDTPGSAADVPLKKKRIAQLTDADLYTCVTLEGVEFVFRQGAFLNISEPYAQYLPKYHQAYAGKVSGRMDTWATAARDRQGNALYLYINTLCDWRRDGDGVPRGTGDITGVLTRSPLRRHGDDMGRYQLRPYDRGSIAVSDRSAAWKTLTGWTFNTPGDVLSFAKAGRVEDLSKKKMHGNEDRVLNDVGAKAFLWTTHAPLLKLYKDLDALTPENLGDVRNGALALECNVRNWYRGDGTERNHAVIFSFSTKKIKGSQVQFSFDMAAGNGQMKSAWDFPYYWKVEYSTDGGRNWKPARDAVTGRNHFTLRTVPTGNQTLEMPAGKRHVKTQYDCGLGLQQHVFALDDAAGKKEVQVRLSPDGPQLAAVHAKSFFLRSYDPKNRWNPDRSKWMVIRFGTVSVDYCPFSNR